MTFDLYVLTDETWYFWLALPYSARNMNSKLRNWFRYLPHFEVYSQTSDTSNLRKQQRFIHWYFEEYKLQIGENIADKNCFICNINFSQAREFVVSFCFTILVWSLAKIEQTTAATFVWWYYEKYSMQDSEGITMYIIILIEEQKNHLLCMVNLYK